MTVLLLGGWGQVGRAFQRQAAETGKRFAAPRKDAVDVTRRDQIESSLGRLAPELVLNLAAYTTVDQAESEPEVAFAVNRDGPSNLAQACQQTGIPLVHVSTDYVFDGTKAEPYVENDPVNPLNVYGRSKLAGEEVIRGRLREHIVLRTSWIFGQDGNNFPKTIMRLAAEKPELSIVDDQWGCPTSADSIASALLHIIAHTKSRHESFPWGTYHFAGTPPTTWFRFAKHIVDGACLVEYLARKPAVRPVPTSEFPTRASRPAMSILDCAKWRSTFGFPLPDWRGGVASLVSAVAEKAGADCAC